MMKTLIASIALSFVATTSIAQSRNCGDFQKITQHLEGNYGETQQSFGLGSNSQMIAQYANSETGSWTILVISPNGIACLVASGQGWQVSEVTPVGDPA